LGQARHKSTSVFPAATGTSTSTSTAAGVASAAAKAKAPPSGLGLVQMAKKFPFAVGVVIACVKTGVCDYLVQVTLQGKRHDEVDWSRIRVFLGFGAVYLGACQWFIYVALFGRLFPGMTRFADQPWREKLKNYQGMRALAGQVAFDNFVHYPLLYFPVFYVFKESIQGNLSDANPTQIAKEAMSKYYSNMWSDNLAIWALWIPADIVVYSCPMWLRLPLNHGISFVWTCILSFMRGDAIKEEEQDDV